MSTDVRTQGLAAAMVHVHDADQTMRSKSAAVTDARPIHRGPHRGGVKLARERADHIDIPALIIDFLNFCAF
jgi:hypothetical protein